MTIGTDESHETTDPWVSTYDGTAALAEIVEILLSHSVDGVTRAVRVLGEATGVDRCYVVRLPKGTRTMDLVAEWCADGMAPRKHDFRGLLCEAYPWFMSELWQGHQIAVPDVSDMPDTASREQSAFHKWGVRSFLGFPMFMGKRLTGFVGLEVARYRREWLREDECLVRTASLLMQASDERESLNRECLEMSARLETALAKAVGGDIPVCNRCKRVQDRDGNWIAIELFLHRHTEATLNQSLCPYCRKGLFPGYR